MQMRSPLSESHNSPNYTNGVSPEMERKGKNRSEDSSSRVRASLNNPRTKRRLLFEDVPNPELEYSEEEGEGQDFSVKWKDGAFRDLASVLRGVLAVQRNKSLKILPCKDAAAKQGRFSKPQSVNEVVKAKRRLNLAEVGGRGGSLQNFKRFASLLGEEKMRAVDLRKNLVWESVNKPVVKKGEKIERIRGEKIGNFVINEKFNKCSVSLPNVEGVGQGFEKSCEGVGSGVNYGKNAQILKGLGKYVVQKPVSKKLDRNMKIFCGDQRQDLGDEAVDPSFLKCSSISSRKRRSEEVGEGFEKPYVAVREGLCESKVEGNGGVSQGLGKFLGHELVNEPAHERLKRAGEDRSEKSGNKVMDRLYAKDCGNEPVGQSRERSCRVLPGIRGNEPKVRRKSQKLNDLGNNLVQERSEPPGNQAIDQSYVKYNSSSGKTSRSESFGQNLGESCVDLREWLCSEPRFDGSVQDVKDLGQTSVQVPVNELIELNKGNGDGTKELINEFIDKNFVTYNRSSIKESRNESSVIQGFEKPCEVLTQGFCYETKLQTSTALVGTNVRSDLISNKSISVCSVTENKEPYPDFRRPISEECREVRDQLLELHGFPEEFKKFRSRLKEEVTASAGKKQLLPLHPRNCAKDTCSEKKGSEIVPTVVPYEVRETILDSLISTLLSQNTTDANSSRAFATLKEKFPTWDDVHKADAKAVEDAIRCGGLAETKTSRIRNILDTLLKERGKICLEHLRNMPVENIKAELCRFKGVGSKTVACVLMFHLQQDDFPVDTHVFRIAKSLGWVPAEADREKAYLHLNCRIPNDLKFDLNCLLVTHGKRCPGCSKRGRAQKTPDGPCPLLRFEVDNS